MLKKLFCGLMAASMLFATSCQQQELTPAMEGEATVTFNVGTPEIATRAYSDGTTATHFQYAVYDENGKELKDLTVANGEIHGSTTVNLKLKTGSQYSVLFWAAAPNAPYVVDLSDATMRVDYANALSNDETRDAFYKYITFDVTGAQSMDVELKRPFAQLNIGTADYADAAKAGFEPTQSYVKVPVYTTLDFKDGNVGGQEVRTFDWADFNRAETFPVAGYEYMAMNYLLVSAEKEVVEVEFGYREAGDEEVRTVGAVPVQRNHRTNIYGGLITSDIDITVTIDPIFEDPAYEADDLYRAAAFGGTVTLTENTTLTSPLNVQANMVLNMSDDVTLTGSIIVPEGIDFIVNGGNVSGNNKDYSAIESKGNLTLNDVTVTSIRHAVRIEGGVAEINGGYYGIEGYAGRTQHALNISGASKVIVNGGTFVGPKGTSADSGSAVNVQSGSEVTINGGIFSKGKNKTLACNGTLKVFGGVYDQDPSAYMQGGYKALQSADNQFVVVAEDVNATTVAVATEDNELREALKTVDYVVLAGDLNTTDAESNGYGATGITINGKILDGNGYTFEVEGATSTWDSAIAISSGTIKNITVAKGFRGIFVKNGSAKVVLENVVIDGPTYTISCDAAGQQGIEATSCTFNGWTSYAGTIGDAKFENCSFGKGAGYAFCRPYAPTEFVGCEFAAGYQMDPRAAVTFENCTINGVALTAENLATLVTSNIANASVK